MKKCHLHLISDSTGGTLDGVTKACLAQFEGIEVEEHIWTLVRTERQLKRVIDAIKEIPGPVMFTLVDPALAKIVHRHCEALNVPSIALLQPAIKAFSDYFELDSMERPGLQHKLNEEYFARMDAVDYALHHDDGQKTQNLAEADIILTGVSRTSKTPTSIYLANRGVKAANVPLVPNIPIPEELTTAKNALVVGLTARPEHLVGIRKTRLKQLGQEQSTDYLDLDQVEEEVKNARHLFTRMGWPVIDVTRRSVEETAAEILSLLARLKEQRRKTNV